MAAPGHYQTNRHSARTSAKCKNQSWSTKGGYGPPGPPGPPWSTLVHIFGKISKSVDKNGSEWTSLRWTAGTTTPLGGPGAFSVTLDHTLTFSWWRSGKSKLPWQTSPTSAKLIGPPPSLKWQYILTLATLILSTSGHRKPLMLENTTSQTPTESTLLQFLPLTITTTDIRNSGMQHSRLWR